MKPESSGANPKEPHRPSLQRAGAELRNPPRFVTRPDSKPLPAPRRERDAVRILLAGAVLLPICFWVVTGLRMSFGETLPLIGILMLMVAVPLVPLAKWVLLETWTHRHR